VRGTTKTYKQQERKEPTYDEWRTFWLVKYQDIVSEDKDHDIIFKEVNYHDQNKDVLNSKVTAQDKDFDEQDNTDSDEKAGDANDERAVLW